MKTSFILLASIFILILSACHSQQKEGTTHRRVGGPCEGCEAVFESGTAVLLSTDTLPGYSTHEPRLRLSGTVFRSDRVTPAPGVILYIYHTNREGIYEKKGDETGVGRRHGYIRGWIKTDDQGKYTFYTFRPGAYPARDEPEHIHVIVKESDKNEYYIDDFLFDDDPLLTAERRAKQQNRGGSGIVRPVPMGEIYRVERNIFLGMNVPDYPEK